MREISLMYSGGVDSTFSAILLAKKFDKVHLLTFNNGFTCWRPSRKNVILLKKRFGKDKFHHKIINFSNFWKKLQLKNLKLFRKYPTMKLMCLSCRMAMAAFTIIYNKKHNIEYVAEGTGKDQSYNLDQNKYYIKMIESLFKKHGMKYTLPSFTYTFKEKLRFLKKYGISYRFFVKLPKTRGIFLDGQPFCFIGNLLYPFWYLSNPKNDIIRKYMDEISLYLEDYIRKN